MPGLPRELDVPVQVATSLGGAAGALIDLSSTSALVMVGGRRPSALGSSSSAPPRRRSRRLRTAPCVVVPGSPAIEASAPVVLGVDGSAESQAACELAFTRAADTGRALTAVHTWWLDTPAPMGLTTLSDDVVDTMEKGHRELAADSVRIWSEKYPDVQVERVVVRADPVAALLDAAAHADLLVVGSRGHGGFTRLFLGSVSQGILNRQHTCPVVVVHRGDPV